MNFIDYMTGYQIYMYQNDYFFEGTNLMFFSDKIMNQSQKNVHMKILINFLFCNPSSGRLLLLRQAISSCSDGWNSM